MAFRRANLLGDRPPSGVLTGNLVGIGMNFAAPANPDAPIEQTLVHATALGMDEGDFRVLSVVTTWLRIHHAMLNADRLIRCVSEHPSDRVHAYWSAVARWLAQDRRLAKLFGLYSGAPVELLPVGTDFQVARRGEDPRFVGSSLRVPRGTLRDREDDVIPPEALLRRHAGYRNRVKMGPTWRADVWTVLEADPEIGPAEAARRAGCSFATAWQVTQDFALFRRADLPAG